MVTIIILIFGFLFCLAAMIYLGIQAVKLRSEPLAFVVLGIFILATIFVGGAVYNATRDVQSIAPENMPLLNGK